MNDSSRRKRQSLPPIKLLLMMMGVFDLAGCTMIPKLDRPAPPVAERFPGANEVSSQQFASDLEWKRFFADQRLVKLIELALDHNRDLRVATLNIQKSRAQYRVTRSASFPSVAADGGYSAERAGSLGQTAAITGPGHGIGSGNLTVHQWTASVGISAYEVDFFGRVRSLNEQALETYFATVEAQRSAQISLVAEVATQYFTLRAAEQQLRIAEQTQDAVQGSYDLNKITFDAGASNELDLRTAEGEVQSAKVNVLTYQRQLAQAQNALVLLIGEPLPPDVPEPLAFDTGAMLAAVPAGLPSDLVQRRPDILEAEHTLRAANANIGAARAAFFPTISLTSSIGSTSTQLSQLFGSGNGTWSFAPQISVPLFTGGQNRANLDAAKISTRIEVANYEKAIQTAFREVADALIANSTYAEEIVAEAAAISTQQRRLELATLRYRQGEDSYLNVLSAQQDLYSAQQGRIQAQLNHLASGISLYEALGGGWK
jgi:multidrug efflux system outer membrane protein